MGVTSTLRRSGGTLAALVIGAGVVVGVGLAPRANAAEDIGQLDIVLDISGSMDEPDGNGSTKITTAKRAVHTVADHVPDGAQLGVRVYGGSCQDTLQLVPVGPVDRARTKAAVDPLKPAGETPIAYALERAGAHDFTQAAGQKTIVLVSDGKETCGGDPVAAAKKLADRLCIDVVGFRVDATTREQLTQIAQAACGKYYDAHDGAALISRLERASLRALRPYRAVGTPVEGTATKEDAPVLRPGRYVDVAPAHVRGDEPSRFYAFDLPGNTTAHVAAAVPWSTKLGTPVDNGLPLKIRNAGTDKICGDRKYHTSYDEGGSLTAYVAHILRPDPKAGSGECGSPGRYLIDVGSYHTRTGAAPLELQLVLEPGVRNENSLPKYYTEEMAAIPPEVSGDPQPVAGSGAYGDAPVLGRGVYQDTLRPGEEIYYRVPLTWGQRLAYQVEFPELDAEQRKRFDMRVALQTAVLSPGRWGTVQQQGSAGKSWYIGSPLTLTASTVPVRYRNRDTEWPTWALHLAGYYTIYLRFDTATIDPYFELPVTLRVDVKGEPTGAPRYADPHGFGTPEQQLEGKSPGGGTGPDGRPGDDRRRLARAGALWTGIALGSVLVVLGITLMVVRLRRRQPWH